MVWLKPKKPILNPYEKILNFKSFSLKKLIENALFIKNKNVEAL